MLDSMTLYNQTGSSDKVYQVAINEKEGGYTVDFSYGRRGTTLKPGTKTKTPVSLDEAKKVFAQLVQEKTRKGYVADGEATVSHVDPTDSTVRCQLLNAIEEAQVIKCIRSDEWWAQPKKDGRRMMVLKNPQSTQAINRKGLFVGGPVEILASVEVVRPDEVLVDGEAVGNTLYAFDLIDEVNPYRIRLTNLGQLDFGPNVVVVPTAKTTAEKQLMFDQLKSEGAEGIVFKRHDALYQAGRPNRGGDQLKFKFYDTASVRVVAQNDRRSVAMAVVNDLGHEVPIGNVTITPDKDVPPVGAIIEVRYLYAYEGGSLYQPTYLCQRDDVEVDNLTDLKFKA